MNGLSFGVIRVNTEDKNSALTVQDVGHVMPGGKNRQESHGRCFWVVSRAEWVNILSHISLSVGTVPGSVISVTIKWFDSHAGQSLELILTKPRLS